MPRRSLSALALAVVALVVGVALVARAIDDDDDVDADGAVAQTATGEDDGRRGFAAIPRVVDEVRPSVVAVLARGAGGAGEGSGVIVDPDGTVVTNNHVVEDARSVSVQFASGERVPAEVRATDPLTDLAVLDVEGEDLPAAKFAEELPDVGEIAVAIGNPLGFESSVTAGIVSGIDRAIPTGGRTPALVGLLQTDAPISPGNSGGALVDADGEVIGINVAFIPPQQGAVAIGFAIPSPTVVDVVAELIGDGEVEHSYLGVGLEPLTPAIAERFGIPVESGAIVGRVEAGSPADEAGIRPGDVIVAMAGTEIASIEDVFAVLREHEPGERIPIEVIREGERRELLVTLAERPS